MHYGVKLCGVACKKNIEVQKQRIIEVAALIAE
jgi:hypothetical protein